MLASTHVIPRSVCAKPMSGFLLNYKPKGYNRHKLLWS